ncbi:DUF3231 family protein [Alkalibacillus silvisoli]|uniref:DUF3231 family protein n=1 Tax=Alkalibacillus silvisoli TaxID=392823 RepID=A0ABN1A1T9_9BACI
MASSYGKWIEASVKVLKELNDNSKGPVHVGEAMACWTYLAFVESIIAYEEVGLNMTLDKDVKKFINDAYDVANSHIKEMTTLMRNEGIPIASSPAHKPISDPRSVPVGARMSDEELMNTLSINFVYAGDMCAASASQCLRTDLGLMFLKFQIDKFSLGFSAKEMMKKRGWLKVPPAYRPPGSPDPENN